MLVIDKAILHVLDLSSGQTAYSDSEMEIKDSIATFLEKHIEKSWSNQSSKPGRFYDDSELAGQVRSYAAGEMDFVALSQAIARKIEAVLTHADELVSADVIVADVRIDDQRQLVIFKCNSHMGFTHQVYQTDDGVQTDIVNHYSIMPGLTQRMDEWAFINLADMQLIVAAKKYSIDGNSIYALPEMVLEADLRPSPQEAMKKLSQTAAKVADDYGRDKVAVEQAVKNYVTERMQADDELDVAAAGQKIFADDPGMQQQFREEVQEAGFTEPVHMDQEATLKKVCKHKLKTDTGIELSIPTDYFDNTEYVEFYTNDDGTLSITLKHIASIINK